jgi:hypothetical protein
MRKGKSKKTREWGPEAFIEWMLKSKNVSKGNIKLLLESRDDISHAWDRDDHGTKGFPMNTAHLLYEIEMTLKGWRPRRRKPGIPYPKTPTRLLDILPESTVRQVHEYLHEEPFQEALAELHSADTQSRALNRIKETVNSALYVERHGYETLPKPRGNWLHRQVLGVFTAVAPGNFSDSEMVKLFDYFCPCGTEHNRETMKKFRWRLARVHG